MPHLQIPRSKVRKKNCTHTKFTCLYELVSHLLLPQLHVCRRLDTKLLNTLRSHKQGVSHIRFLGNNPYKYCISQIICLLSCTKILFIYTSMHAPHTCKQHTHTISMHAPHTCMPHTHVRITYTHAPHTCIHHTHAHTTPTIHTPNLHPITQHHKHVPTYCMCHTHPPVHAHACPQVHTHTGLARFEAAGGKGFQPLHLEAMFWLLSSVLFIFFCAFCLAGTVHVV